MNMRYNLACVLSAHLGDANGALDRLGPYFAKTSRTDVAHARIDPDMDPIRQDPRFAAMIAEAEARPAAADDTAGCAAAD